MNLTDPNFTLSPPVLFNAMRSLFPLESIMNDFSVKAFT